MSEQLFGAKELYDVVLRTTFETTINGKHYDEGEVVVRFGRLQIAQLNGRYSYVAAKGGYDNRELVTWENMNSVSFTFSQGVFSKTQLAFLTNSSINQQAMPEKKLVPKTETLEADDEGAINLQFIPQKLFVYQKDGSRVKDFVLDGQKIKGLTTYEEYVCDYYYEYQENIVYLQSGLGITNGYLRMEGKTRLKDDNTGHIVTGLITIPRLKLKTGISARLGANAEPVIGTFQGEGYPVGTRGNKTVCSLTILSDDIDSDF